MITKEVTIKIKAANPFDLKVKIQALESISRLDVEKQNTIIEIASNSKYMEQLHKNKELLKSFIQ
ncbi:MAG: hypothetical protein ACK4K1_02505 [Flavobacterium sp.]